MSNNWGRAPSTRIQTRRLKAQRSATGNLRASEDSSIQEKKDRRKTSLALRAATRAAAEGSVDESSGWEALCDVLTEVDEAPRITLEYPPSGFAYVTDDDGGVYRICTYGIDECRLYMGPESCVAIPDDPEDAAFAEGQGMEDIWTAVLERQAAADEALGLCEGVAPGGAHFLAIPVRDIMPALQGGAPGDNAPQEMSNGQTWCLRQMVKYDREAPLTFK
ncbi:hypothetical protein C8J57DRAFT_1714105 [Mycena rebaudengoi]|nr:hypothetical protein C8J57DRAFT_1714105 [Mycena rebaudengoi]